MTEKNKAGQKSLFRGTAWYYARYRPEYPQALFQRLIERLHLNGSGHLVDLGCGTGELAIPLHNCFEGVYAVDEDADMLMEGKRKAKRLGANNIQWIEGRAEDVVGDLEKAIKDMIGPVGATLIKFGYIEVGADYLWQMTPSGIPQYTEDLPVRGMDHYKALTKQMDQYKDLLIEYVYAIQNLRKAEQAKRLDQGN